MTKFLQLASSGVALGAVYSLVALGYVVVYRATRIINFAQGGMVLLGAYLVYTGQHDWGMPLWLAAVVAIGITGAIGAAFQFAFLRRMAGQPTYALILITIGLLIILEQVVPAIWPAQSTATQLQTPWGLRRFSLGSARLLQVDLAAIVLTGLVLVAFYLAFEHTKVGVAMRATALDRETAAAQGIRVGRIFALSWFLAGAVAVVAGLMLGSNAGPSTGLSGTIELVALTAFPVLVLGGLDSPLGAVVGGLAIGVAQVLTGGYQPQAVPFLGETFGSVMPWVLMILVLIIWPYGLFGSRDVRRV